MFTYIPFYCLYFSVFLFRRQENRKVPKEKRNTELFSIPSLTFGHFQLGGQARTQEILRSKTYKICPKGIGNDCVFFFLG